MVFVIIIAIKSLNLYQICPKGETLLFQLNITELLDPRLAEAPMKSICLFCLSVCLSFHQFSVFFKNSSLVFSDFCHNGR